jgi:type VI secretion system secreted protein Hcp
MAETVHLFLKANGTAIDGQSTQTSVGRDKSIECIEFEHEVDTAREAASGIATGRRTYRPLKIVKRIDKSTPLIAKALVTNQMIEGKFLFFRPNPLGDGTTQQFYSVEIGQGRVASIKQFVPNTTADQHSAEHPLEEITFTFHTIKWTWVDGGVEHQDSWSQNT